MRALLFAAVLLAACTATRTAPTAAYSYELADARTVVAGAELSGSGRVTCQLAAVVAPDGGRVDYVAEVTLPFYCGRIRSAANADREWRPSRWIDVSNDLRMWVSQIILEPEDVEHGGEVVVWFDTRTESGVRMRFPEPYVRALLAGVEAVRHGL